MSLYVGTLLCYYLMPNIHYWYLWPTIFYFFTTYIIICTIFSFIKSFHCFHQINGNNNNPEDHRIITNNNNRDTDNRNVTRRAANNLNTNLEDILMIDGLSQNEWLVASLNISCITSILTIMCYVISRYKKNYDTFVHLRTNFLLDLVIIESFWIGFQIFMLHLRYYGTIFYILLLIPTILLCASALYALYEYFILSILHLFLSIVITCGEFQLLSTTHRSDYSVYDFNDWTILGMLAVLTKLFSFRMPQ